MVTSAKTGWSVLAVMLTMFGLLVSSAAAVETKQAVTEKKPVAAKKLAAATEKKTVPVLNAQPVPKIQMAILLDTSSSMTGLINQARSQLWKIVNEFATATQNGKQPTVEVALYEYGNSGLPGSEGYLRMIVPLTDDLDKVSKELFALTTSGGSEYCGQVIDAATRALEWDKSNKHLKCIFIAGNEPFTQGPVDFRKACQAAVARGITVSTIHCGPESVGIRTHWQEGALMADGSFMNIDQNRAVVGIAAPQDKQLALLSARLNTTYIAYGTSKKRRAYAANQIAQDRNAAGSSHASNSSRAQLKASRLYVNTAWDLVDALRLGKIKLEDLKDNELPDSLRKLTLIQRKAYIEKKGVERKVIQEQIKKLSTSRTQYIAAERKRQADAGGAESLDTAIIRSIRSQAVKRNFKFKE